MDSSSGLHRPKKSLEDSGQGFCRLINSTSRPQPVRNACARATDLFQLCCHSSQVPCDRGCPMNKSCSGKKKQVSNGAKRTPFYFPCFLLSRAHFFLLGIGNLGRFEPQLFTSLRTILLDVEEDGMGPLCQGPTPLSAREVRGQPLIPRSLAVTSKFKNLKGEKHFHSSSFSKLLISYPQVY